MTRRAVAIPASPAKGLPVRRVVAALSVSTFVEWAGASAVIPLLPIYLRHHGASDTVVGATMGAFFLAAVFVQYPVGRLSDRIGRRPVQIAGLVAFAAASLLFAVVVAPAAALFLRGLQGAGAGIVDVANNSTIGDVVPASQQGRAYGAMFGARTGGLAIGPFLGGLAGVGATHIMLAGAAVASLLACIPILLLVPRVRPVKATGSRHKVILRKSRSVVGVVLGFAAAGLMIGTYEVCWTLWLHYRGATSWQIGLSWTLFALPFAVMSIPAGWLTDHLDRRYLALGATVVSAGFAIAYPLMHDVWLLIGTAALEAVAVATAGPALNAQLAHSVSSRDLGRAQGAASTSQTGTTALAAVAAGSLFGLQPWLPFVMLAIGVTVLSGAMGLAWRGVPGRGHSGALESSDQASLDSASEVPIHPVGSPL